MKLCLAAALLLICIVSIYEASILKKGIAKDVKDSVTSVGKQLAEGIKDKVTCAIPDGVSEASRVALLQKCASKEEDGSCYDELGCFPMGSPWVSTLRPVPAPYEPGDIDTSMILYTRKYQKGSPVSLWPVPQFDKQVYNKDRPKTIFITHGFASNGEADWILNLKDVLLKKTDANVFIVDWKNGSSLMNYFQAASNTRIVGAEINRFAQKLIEDGLDVKKIYLIGHSLGAHTMAYAAKRIKNVNNQTDSTNGTRVGRLTALDPAQPCFEFTDSSVRLDSEDADFVDVFHTDARPFLPLFGFGMMSPAGDVDYYFAGGSLQPGCISNALPNKITSLEDIRNMTVEVIDGIVSCSHGRSHQYFTSSLNFSECGFVGRKISNLEKVLNVASLGIAKYFTTPIAKMVSEKNETVVGYESEFIPARGNFLMEIKNTKPPFCDSSMEFKEIKNAIFKAIKDRVSFSKS
ncbi:pancreatic lipase-related protein 2-like [Cimex lectularius]|uniref:Lipase domain-containing protein n=1 Tax=Cimex lectularius TaxID=79782 RepID=A0A8I6SDK4_CIMLE|nr:pancreatic lipase-related protein 2-like [Cimex lectularius]